MKINHISVSRAQTFQECPCKYKFRYHLQIVPDGPEPPYFAYGKTLHKIAETYVARGEPGAFAEIAMDVLCGKIEIEPGKKAPALEGDYKKKIHEHLKNLKRFINQVGLDSKGHTEYSFRYDLDPPNECYTVGFIDRIVQKGDQFFILDYKTTKKGPFRKDQSTVLKDLQLRMYAKVVQKEFGAKAENICCCLFYMDGGESYLFSGRPGLGRAGTARYVPYHQENASRRSSWEGRKKLPFLRLPQNLPILFVDLRKP